MANTKISALTSATTPLAGTEVLPIVQSSATVKVATNDLTVRNVRANATTGILQVTGPAAASTRVMTTPDANFTVARTDAAQSFTGDQTLSTGNIIQGTAGKGFNFTANANAAGMTSELLNWYEEGTWTANLTTTGTPPTTPITTTCRYTRIGRQVTIQAQFENVTIVGATGSLRITGVPFNAGTGIFWGSVALAGFVAVSPVASIIGGNIDLVNSTTLAGIAVNNAVGLYVFTSITYFV